MCGIFSYIGDKNCVPILIGGLKDLEYRGYDSAGIYVDGVGAIKSVGQVKNLANRVKGLAGNSGIAHTRWATHGKPSETNAHPHTGSAGRIWLVHNGVIENYKELKSFLVKKKIIFKSDTDTEVISQLIEYYLVRFSMKESILKTVNKLRGSYALSIIDSTEPNIIYAVKNRSPLIIGLGEKEMFVSSDSNSLNQYTNKLIFLGDREIGLIRMTGVQFFDFNGRKIFKKPVIFASKRRVATLKMRKHYMLDEIMDQPEIFSRTLKNRLKKGKINFTEIKNLMIFKNVEKVIIVGCGTAYNSGLLAKYFFEEYLNIPTEAETSSEFRYRHHPIDKTTLLIAISQSGETADTREAIAQAKLSGAYTCGIVNVSESTISREVDCCIYTNAGQEISVASTKAFTAQALTLILLGCFIDQTKNSKTKKQISVIKELKTLPNKMQTVLKQTHLIRKIAKYYLKNTNFLYVGRKYHYPIALESALKLKEISYIHAEGCGAGEMKHGPLAMIDRNFPVVMLVPNDSLYEKNISTIREVRARDGKVIAIITDENIEVKNITDHRIVIPTSSELLISILSTISLQLFAYHLADLKNIDVDKPRNLAKSVTVE